MKNIKDIMTSFLDILKMINEYTNSGSQNRTSSFGGRFGSYNNNQGGQSNISLEDAPMYATILCEGILAFINIFSNNMFTYTKDDMKKYIEISKTVKEYFKVLKAVFGSYNLLLRALNKINESSEEHPNIIQEITDIKTNLKAFISILNDNAFDVSKIKDETKKAKTVSDYIKILNKNILKNYNKLIKKLDKEPEETATYITAFKDNLLLLNKEMTLVNENSKDLDVSALLNIIVKYNKIAVFYNRLMRLLKTQDSVKQGIMNFIDNIKILTGPDVISAMKSDVAPIKKYIRTLQEFTTQVSSTTRTINIYVTSMERAKKAMKNLDDVIIKNKDKRNKALDELCTRINQISDAVFTLTDAVYDMADAFAYIEDETEILNMFKGTQELIESVTGMRQSDTTTGAGGQTQNGNQQQEPRQRPTRTMRQQNQNNNGNNPNGNNPNDRRNNRENGRFKSQGVVQFIFQTGTLNGEYIFK